MGEGIDQKPECEHAWVHKSTSVGLWVPQCHLCGEFNNADLGQQIAKVKADALREAAGDLLGNPPSVDIFGKPLPGHIEAQRRLLATADQIEGEA